ncbi:hypothetical protein Tco_1522079, partial [Tanacetum coccineum]
SVAQASISTTQDTAGTQGTAQAQNTDEVQDTDPAQGTAAIPNSPNDYTPTDVSQTSGGDEGLLDLYALNREVKRLKRQTLSQAKQIFKLKKLSKFVQPVVKHHAFWVESQNLKKQKRRRKKQKKKVSSVKLGRNKEEGTLSEEHYVQEEDTADPFFDSPDSQESSHEDSLEPFLLPYHPLKNMEDRGIFDNGCSGHMTGNKDHLDDFEECKGGSVTFGGRKGYITGKGRIRVGKLDFDSVSFLKELGHFNLFSISQICDKHHKVLFTETECLVVS